MAQTTPQTPIDEALDIPAAPHPDQPAGEPADELVEEDLLVEDVSIDGMCGVY